MYHITFLSRTVEEIVVIYNCRLSGNAAMKSKNVCLAVGRQPYNTDQYRSCSTVYSATSTEIYAITFLGRDTSKAPSSSTRQKE
jgi:hypothetical protein